MAIENIIPKPGDCVLAVMASHLIGNMTSCKTIITAVANTFVFKFWRALVLLWEPPLPLFWTSCAIYTYISKPVLFQIIRLFWEYSNFAQ